MGLSFAAKAFDNIFVSTLSSKIGLQFLINHLFRSFLSNTLLTFKFYEPCFCDILRLPFILASFNELMKTSFISFQNVS